MKKKNVSKIQDKNVDVFKQPVDVTNYIDVNFEFEKNRYQIEFHKEFKVKGLLLRANDKFVPYKLREEGYHVYPGDSLNLTLGSEEMQIITEKLS